MQVISGSAVWQESAGKDHSKWVKVSRTKIRTRVMRNLSCMLVATLQEPNHGSLVGVL